MFKLLTNSVPHVVTRVIKSDCYYEVWSDGIIKFYGITSIISTTNGYIELDRPSIIEGKEIMFINVTNIYVSKSNSINATITAQDNIEGKIVFYFRIGNETVVDFKVKVAYEIVVYDSTLVE